jgi:hypothetical protein
MGVRSLDGGGAQGALKASVVNASKGIGSFNVVGILSDLINSSHGSGIGGTTTGTLEFNSN